MTDVPAGLTLPRYAEASLANVGPSLLAALGVPGEKNPLGVEPVARAVLFVVDGLGWRGLQSHAAAAPYLSSMSATTLTAGFPSTTVTSLSSIGTGLPPGEHGLTGYTSYVQSVGQPVNWLAWRPAYDGGDLRDRLVPEVVQPRPTVWERAESAGLAVAVCTYDRFEDSGLTRAVLRGGRWGGTLSEGDAVARAADLADRGHRSLTYVYVSALDLVGHMRGPDADAWAAQLGVVDRLAEQLGARLPPGTALFVTADHGMVAVAEDAKVDADGVAALREDVVALAGEPRARHVHARPGAAADVAARWRDTLGTGWWVLERGAAVALGLFGPIVTPEAAERIGDVVALAVADGGVVERRRLPRLAAMPGQHGSLTDDELFVPLLEARR